MMNEECWRRDLGDAVYELEMLLFGTLEMNPIYRLKRTLIDRFRKANARRGSAEEDPA